MKMTPLLLLLLAPAPSLSQYKIVRHNPFAELAATLASWSSYSCDGQDLVLSCPGDTRISITSVEYGTSPTSSCSPTNTSCSLPHAPLLRVQASCQSQASCSLPVSPSSLAPASPDPCPSLTKQASVSYHCRPAVYRSALLCLSSPAPLLSLSCPLAATRILVFQAAFVAAGDGAVHCPREGKTQGWRDGAVSERLRRCEGEAVTGPLVQACHGQVNFPPTPTLGRVTQKWVTPGWVMQK